MKIARFKVNGRMSYGLVEGERIKRISRNPFGRFNLTGEHYLISEVKLLVPTKPTMFYSATVNYRDHAKWVSKTFGRPTSSPSYPDPNYRSVGALIAHGEPIVIPKEAKQVQWEGELVVVIGRKTRNVSERDAHNYILGYTICNDIGERVWQRQDSSLWRVKGADSFKPLGPWVATDIDPLNAKVVTRVNGQVVHSYNTSSMVFGPAAYVSMMSRYLTLYPGDLITMGVDGEPGDMKPGDIVEIEISGIGVLRNPVVLGR